MTDSDEIIPDTKLNRILTVSLSELENYKIYCGYGGNELKLDGKDYLIMREDDILAII